MNLKEFLIRPKSDAPRITIFGEGGTGKTLLASTFPNPVFIRAEDGFTVFDSKTAPFAFPTLKTGVDIFEQLDALIEQKHNFKTLVIDSVTSLSVLFEKTIMNSSGAKNMAKASGGFGGGYQELAKNHADVKAKTEILRLEKGMTIVFIAHADIEKLEQPDEPSYTRYSMRIHKLSITHYTDFVDLVGLLKLNTVVNNETGKAKSFGDRVLICDKRASSIAKNRYGITEEIEVPEGENPLLSIIPFYKQPATEQ